MIPAVFGIILPKSEIQICCWAVPAHLIIAIGVDAARSCFNNCETIAPKVLAPIKITKVGIRESASQSKSSGEWAVIAAKPRLSTGSVRGIPASKGATNTVDKPGTTSYSHCAAISASSSDVTRPKIKGSPLLSRITCCPV